MRDKLLQSYSKVSVNFELRNQLLIENTCFFIFCFVSVCVSIRLCCSQVSVSSCGIADL